MASRPGPATRPLTIYSARLCVTTLSPYINSFLVQSFVQDFSLLRAFCPLPTPPSPFAWKIPICSSDCSLNVTSFRQPSLIYHHHPPSWVRRLSWVPTAPSASPNSTNHCTVQKSVQFSLPKESKHCAWFLYHEFSVQTQGLAHSRWSKNVDWIMTEPSGFHTLSVSSQIQLLCTQKST